jgi:hypothetical protein
MNHYATDEARRDVAQPDSKFLLKRPDEVLALVLRQESRFPSCDDAAAQCTPEPWLLTNDLIFMTERDRETLGSSVLIVT